MRRKMSGASFSFRLFVSSLFTTLFLIQSSLASNPNQQGQPDDYLTEGSVVLITGAAGFLGSELALALHRTYNPKQIICVDRMSENPSSQEELALFEFQRQRTFSVFQTLGSKGSFYRVDFRPMIPEYFELGEVPVLDHIFREHPDITHVVHLADPFPHAALQVISREKDVPKAGMTEALMEQLLKIQRTGNRVPHFVYASSSEVYPSSSQDPPSPFAETHTISTPSSLRGAAKLIDETLAKMYNDMHGIYSVGLRFFSVYGPWSAPGSPLFEMAERAVTGDSPLWDSKWKNIKDYVYIDDAVDAMMAAMQFRPQGEKHTPIVFNVASGQGASLKQIVEMMEYYFPRQKSASMQNIPNDEDGSPTVSYGSTKRAEKFLGYKPRVSLEDGIVKLLAWHYDRAFPYGGGNQRMSDDKAKLIASKGIESCFPNDRECLKATPVFPCASECSHEVQCIDSFYDEIIGWTQSVTKNCELVLYTVDLDNNLESLPSAHLKVRSKSKSFVDGNCNLAFVSANSKLFRSTSPSSRMSTFFGGSPAVRKHGEWILVPVNVPDSPNDQDDRTNNQMLSLLPKLSPGLFFSNAKRAIYIDPNILLDSIPKLLQEASMQPYNEEVEGRTAMLIGKGNPADYFAREYDFDNPQRQTLAPIETVVQNAAYRMVRIAVSDMLFDNGFMELMDSRWMVHTLQSDDSRLFRCDVFGEVIQWEVNTDRSALEFVLGLHDMWSQVIARESDDGAWWIGENVRTVPEGYAASPTRRRRLQEKDANGEVADEDGDEDNVDGEGSGDDLDGDKEDAGGEEGDKTGMQAESVQQEEVDHASVKRGGSSEEDIDQDTGDDEPDAADILSERDFSAYDTWMGVLSASSVKYFVRIVPSSEVGVLSLDD
jgi:UDP-glucuronate 4-epimerase